jgi:hypothetical protein
LRRGSGPYELSMRHTLFEAETLQQLPV